MNLYKMYVRRHFKGLLGFTFSVSLMIFLIIILYPYVKDMYAAIPAEVMAILDSFGGVPDNALEYYATEGAMMLQLFSAIYASLLGFGLMSLFEKEKTAEVLYTQGIKKRRFYVAMLLALLTNLVIFNTIQAGFGYLGFWLIEEPIDLMLYAYFQGMNLLTLLSIGLLAFFMSVVLKAQTKPMVSLLISIPLYVLTIIASLTDETWIKSMKHISPFTFSDPVVILKDQLTIDTMSLMIYGMMAFIILVISLPLLKKRIHIV